SLTSTQGTCEIRNPRSPDAALVPPISSVDELHILCNLGDIADGASIEVTLIIATGGPIDGIVSNAVSAASSTPDPDLANNEAGVLVPPPQILGDVNGDGLVDALDRKIVKDCAKQKGQDTPECDTTDVNGDGVVDGRDVAIVAARKFAKRLEPGEEATAEISNNSQLGTVEGALNKIGTFVLDAFGSTKPAIIAEFGVLPNVQKIPSSTLTTGVGAGKNAVFTDIPDGTVVGASGCDPCIGIILLPPEDDPQVFHFAATDDAKDTMKEAGPFPDGTRAAIFGGNNTLESNVTLNLVAEFFRENPQITVEGYSDTVGLWVDREGTFVRRNDKLDALSINVR
ncbi:MAG: dockerin type I domain-containing protein, partial [Candidatus Binatia bacterium]